MIAEERKKKITEFVTSIGIVDVKQLAVMFDVSIYTIRRDLNELEQKGLINKTRGGAVRSEKSSFIPSMEEGMSEAIIEKNQIAESAADLIDEGDTIMLPGTTINQLMLPHIQHKKVMIVTNSIPIAQKSMIYPGLETIILGGRIKSHRGNIFDMKAYNELQQFHFDKCFLAAAGIHVENGITTAALDSAIFSSSVMKRSKQSIFLLDYRKVGRVTFSKICNIQDPELIITNISSDPDQIDTLKQKNAKIILV